MRDNIVGVLSVCFGIIGFFLTFMYIGIITCIIALVLGAVGLAGYMTNKWICAAGLVFSVLGIFLFAYVAFTDIKENRLIILYRDKYHVFLSNRDYIMDNLDEITQSVQTSLSRIEAKMREEEKKASQTNASTADNDDVIAESQEIIDRTE